MEQRTGPGAIDDTEGWVTGGTGVTDREGPGAGRPEPGAPGTGRPRVTPVGVVLVVALLGSLLFLAFALTVRDTSQIPLLASGAFVLGIVFIGLAAAAARSTYQAGTDGRNGRALGLAVGGGVAAIIGFVCVAMAIVLALLWKR